MQAVARSLTTVVLVVCLLSTCFLFNAVKSVAAASDYTFGTENVVLGSSTNPTNKNTEDATYNTLTEGDQYTDTNYSISTETITTGTGGGTAIPTGTDSANDVYRTYAEANLNPSNYVVYLFPTSDTQAQWDSVVPASPTTHYDKLDEGTSGSDTTTSYVYTATNSDKDIFGMGDMSTPSGNPTLQIQCWAYVSKSASQTANCQFGIRIGSTDYSAYSSNPTTSFVNYSAGWSTDPSDAGAWTVTDINALSTYMTTSDSSPNPYVSQLGIKVYVNYTINYGLSVTETFSSVTSTAQTTSYKVNLEAKTSDTESILCQAWDYTGSSWTTKATISATSDTDYSFSLLSTERDGTNNEVKIRFIGNTETGDTSQTTLSVDLLRVQRIEQGYALDIELTSSTAPTYGNITVRVKGYTIAETFQVDVWNYTSSAYDTNKLQITSLSNAWQTTIDLCDGHHRSGTTVKIRFVDVTAASSDTTKDTFYLDVAWITLYYTNPTITNYGATPLVCETSCPVTFWLTYTDYDNQAPTYVYVHIDATDYIMAANDSDTDYFDGKLYGLVKDDITAGVHSYYFKVKDSESGDVTTTPGELTINVPANNAPEFTSSPTATGHNNTLYYYDANAIDEDEDPLTFDLEGSITGWAAINPSTGVVQGTPTEIGDYWMNVSVTDGTATVWQNTSVHIYTDAPSFVTSAITTWQNGTTYLYEAQATDPEAEGLTFDLQGNGTSFVSITPAGYYCDVEGALTSMGWWYLNLSVTDGTNTVWQNWTLTALNTAPEFTFEPILVGVVNESYACPISATDLNSDTLIYSIDASSSYTKEWLTLNLTSMQLEGVPLVNGSYDVNLSVTDGLVTTWTNFTIEVDLNNEDTFQVLNLVIALIFCFGLFFAGLKERLFWIAAGFVWIICGMTVFLEFGEVFFFMGIGMGFVLLIMGVLDYARHR